MPAQLKLSKSKVTVQNNYDTDSISIDKNTKKNLYTKNYIQFIYSSDFKEVLLKPGMNITDRDIYEKMMENVNEHKKSYFDSNSLNSIFVTIKNNQKFQKNLENVMINICKEHFTLYKNTKEFFIFPQNITFESFLSFLSNKCNIDFDKKYTLATDYIIDEDIDYVSENEDDNSDSDYTE